MSTIQEENLVPLRLRDVEGAVQQKIRLYWGEGSMGLQTKLKDPLFRALYLIACEQELEIQKKSAK